MPLEYDRRELTRLCCRPPFFKLDSLVVRAFGPSDSRCVGAGDAETEEPPPDDCLLEGCGNELTLAVLRSVRTPLGMGEGAVGRSGRVETEPICDCREDRGVGRPEDTLRGVVPGVGRSEAPDAGRAPNGVTGELIEPFLDLETGKAGRGTFGGPSDGRDGRGSVADILARHCCVMRSATGVCRCTQRGN